MFIEMSCICSAMIGIDVEDELNGWALANRFAEAHVACGFLAPSMKDPEDLIDQFDLPIYPDQES